MGDARSEACTHVTIGCTPTRPGRPGPMLLFVPTSLRGHAANT